MEEERIILTEDITIDENQPLENEEIQDKEEE